MNERRELYNAFLERFPLSKLSELTLDEYANMNKDDSFCNWLENKTRELCPVGVGFFHKFGIYQYQTKPAEDYHTVICDDKYAWYVKYHKDTAEAAFEVVRNAIVRVATCADEGKFEEIDAIDELGESYKWKIAFHYSHEKLLPIYKTEILQQLARHYHIDPSLSRVAIQRRLLEIKGDRDLYEFYDELLAIDGEYDKKSDRGVWLYYIGAHTCSWEDCIREGNIRIEWDELGDLREYEGKKDIIAAYKEKVNTSDKREPTVYSYSMWYFAHAMKEGDIVYVKNGPKTIIGIGVVEGDYQFDNSLPKFKHVRKVRWTNTGQWRYDSRNSTYTITDKSKDEKFIQDMMNLIQDPAPYTPTDFLSEVFISSAERDHLLSLLQQKKNIILQGAPGVGKTFTARRLAYALMGVKDEERVEMVQFHQNYTYEDFIMGYKPTVEGGFELHKGIFYQFCKKAREAHDKDFFFIIDEINRGNLSKIFGELLMLIEKDYRGTPIQLAYNGEAFSVPDNLYIIGMMNTADRSLAMIDYALRRRFSFYEMKPGFDSEGFIQYQDGVHDPRFAKVIDAIKALNVDIVKDDSLGSGFCIGHSYFCDYDAANHQWLDNVITYDILPMLKEYWFDNKKTYEEAATKLKQALNGEL